MNDPRGVKWDTRVIPTGWGPGVRSVVISVVYVWCMVDMTILNGAYKVTNITGPALWSMVDRTMGNGDDHFFASSRSADVTVCHAMPCHFDLASRHHWMLRETTTAQLWIS